MKPGTLEHLHYAFGLDDGENELVTGWKESNGTMTVVIKRQTPNQLMHFMYTEIKYDATNSRAHLPFEHTPGVYKNYTYETKDWVIVSFQDVV